MLSWSNDTGAGLCLFDADAIGDVVGRDEVEGAVGQDSQSASRSATGRRGGDAPAGAADGIRVVVALVGEDQVVRTGLRRRGPWLLGRGALRRVPRRRRMYDMDGRVGRARTPGRGQSRQPRHRPVASSMVTWQRVTTLKRLRHRRVEQDRILASELGIPPRSAMSRIASKSA